VDGRQHGWEADYDAERTRTLEGMGFVVLRVSNEDVRGNPAAALARIRGALPLP